MMLDYRNTAEGVQIMSVEGTVYNGSTYEIDLHTYLNFPGWAEPH